MAIVVSRTSMNVAIETTMAISHGFGLREVRLAPAPNGRVDAPLLMALAPLVQ